MISDYGDCGDLLDGWTKPAPGVALCMEKVPVSDGVQTGEEGFRDTRLAVAAGLKSRIELLPEGP